MVIVSYGNSYSKISGLSPEQMAGLRKVLSYKVDFATARFIPNPLNRIKYCIDMKGNFASGLLSKVQRFLTKHKIEFWIDNKRPIKEPILTIRDFNPNFHIVPYQDQIEAMEKLTYYDRGVCSMPTGTGKSHVITMLLQKTGMKTLIIVPTLELKYQLTKTLSDAFASGMEGITVENIDSSALATARDYDCLIIDECHRAAAKTYRDLNKKVWTDIRYRYCFSATPFRNDQEEQLLYEGVAGEVIYELTYKDAVAKSYIMPVEAYYFELEGVKIDSNNYSEVYSKLIVNNDSRNDLIRSLLTKLWAEGKSTLCLVKEVKHGQILSELTGIPFSHGQDEESRQWISTFKEGRLKCLIATEGLLGEGIDTKPCEYVILCGGGKARSALMQKIGRTVRKYPGKESGKVILFKDRSHKYMLTSFNTHAKIINEEYNTPVIKLER